MFLEYNNIQVMYVIQLDSGKKIVSMSVVEKMALLVIIFGMYYVAYVIIAQELGMLER